MAMRSSKYQNYIPTYAKCYKNQINLITFSFCADWAILGSTENSAILLKYPTFQGIFQVSLNCRAHPKKIPNKTATQFARTVTQGGGAHSPHPVLRAPPPRFSDLATALLR
jgi:hypothetical protein